MVYPILERVIFDWDTPHSYSVEPVISRYGSGVDRRESLSINPVAEEVDARFSTMYQSQVHTFLRSRRGLPFRLLPQNRMLVVKDLLYSCPKWRWTQLGEGLWRCDARMKRVNILNNPTPVESYIDQGVVTQGARIDLGDTNFWGF